MVEKTHSPYPCMAECQPQVWVGMFWAGPGGSPSEEKWSKQFRETMKDA
jgi:hypothetical protein